MAVDLNNLPPYQRLLAHLYGDTSDASAMQQFNDSPDYRERVDARERLEGALAGKNGEDPSAVVAELAKQFAPQILAPFNVRPEDVVASFQKTQDFPTEQAAQSTQSPTQPQGVSLPGFLQRNKQENPSTGVHVGTAGVPELVHSLQEQELLDAYDASLKVQNTPEHPNAREEAVQVVLNNLDAHSVLRKQWDILNRHVSEYSKQPDVLESLVVQGKRQLDRHLHAKENARENGKENEEIKKEGDKLHNELLEAHSSGDRERAHVALKNLLAHRQRETEQYFVDVEDNQGVNQERLLLGIAQLLRQVLAQQQAQRQARDQSMQARAQAAAQSEASNEDAGFSVAKALGGGGKLKKGSLKSALAKQALEKGAAALLGPEAVPVVKFLEKYWKPLLIGAIILPPLILAVVVMIIMFFLNLLNGATQGTQAQLPASCISTEDCVQKLSSYGITINFVPKYGGSPADKIKETYDTIATITQGPSQFRQLLKLPQQPITITFHDGGCAGHASHNGQVDIYGSCLTDTNRFILTHELGHEIAFRNPDLINKFYNSFPFLLSPAGRGLPFPGSILPTFNCQLDYGAGGPFPGECFADTIGEYPVYHTYRNTVTGPFGVRLPLYIEQRTFETFRLGYPNYFNFARDNIYGGLTY